MEQLKKIADEAGLNVTEDQLKAIAQTAYNAMKAGEKESNTAEPLEALTATPAATVVINTTAPVTTTEKSGYCHRQCAGGCHGNQRRRHSEHLRRSREHYRERDQRKKQRRWRQKSRRLLTKRETRWQTLNNAADALQNKPE